MEQKEINKRTTQHDMTINNDEFYRYIFKKTEKIVCAVFFLIRNEQYSTDDSIVRDTEIRAQNVLEKALATLETVERTRVRAARELKFALIRLESQLRLMYAAHLIQVEYLEVFLHEIDSVQRTLRKYTEEYVQNPLTREAYIPPTMVRQRTRERVDPSKQRSGVPQGQEVVSPTVAQKSRRERVLDVLRDKGEATIKDITEIVKDCSEKTIQRELIGLIDENVIVREGERRWSKYKLV